MINFLLTIYDILESLFNPRRARQRGEQQYLYKAVHR